MKIFLLLLLFLVAAAAIVYAINRAAANGGLSHTDRRWIIGLPIVLTMWGTVCFVPSKPLVIQLSLPGPWQIFSDTPSIMTL